MRKDFRRQAVIGLLALLAAALWGGYRPAQASAPLPLLVLYPRDLNRPDDQRALVDLRKKLREDGRWDILTYDPNSPAVARAAVEAHHPEWLTAPTVGDADRLTLARALGAAFLATVGRAESRGRINVRLVETAPAARGWSFLGMKTDEVARALLAQGDAALAHPAPPAVVKPAAPTPTPVTPAPAPTPPSPVAVKPSAPIPTPVAPIPTPATPAPAPVAPAPVAPAPSPPIAAPTPPAPAPTPPAPAPAPVAPAPAPVTPAPKPLPPALPPISPLAPAPAALNTDASPPARPPSHDDAAARAAAAPLIERGDRDLLQGDVAGAIWQYRQAINEAPLSMNVRLKLAQAYLQGGLRDKALSEAKRAIGIAPDDASVQQFLARLDSENGTSDGAVARYRALVDRNPQSPEPHLWLADALASNGEIAEAETEYKTAQSLAPHDHHATAHLAGFYAAQARYDGCLALLSQTGLDGYTQVVHSLEIQTQNLSAILAKAQDAFAGSKSTRAEYYDTVRKDATQIQALADFVAKITPPPVCKMSYLHRSLAVNLLAQEAAALTQFIETSDSAQSDKAARLEKAAQTELLTARAAEQKQGLWAEKSP